MGRKIRNALIGTTLAGLLIGVGSGIQANRYHSGTKESQAYVNIGIAGIGVTAVGLMGIGLTDDHRSRRKRDYHNNP